MAALKKILVPIILLSFPSFGICQSKTEIIKIEYTIKMNAQEALELGEKGINDLILESSKKRKVNSIKLIVEDKNRFDSSETIISLTFQFDKAELQKNSATIPHQIIQRVFKKEE